MKIGETVLRPFLGVLSDLVFGAYKSIIGVKNVENMRFSQNKTLKVVKFTKINQLYNKYLLINVLNCKFTKINQIVNHVKYYINRQKSNYIRINLLIY